MTHPTGPGHPGPDPGPITPTGPRTWPPSAAVQAEWAPWVPAPDRPGIWLAPLKPCGCWPTDVCACTDPGPAGPDIWLAGPLSTCLTPAVEAGPTVLTGGTR